MSKIKKDMKNQPLLNKRVRYLFLGSILLLPACASSPSLFGSNFSETENSSQVGSFIFDGEEFVSTGSQASQSENMVKRTDDTMSAVAGYRQTNLGYDRQQRSVHQGAFSTNQGLAAEYAAHQRAIQAAKAADIEAKEYAQAAKSMRAASRQALGSAKEARYLQQKQLKEANALQKQANEKLRFARQERERAKRIKAQAEQAAKKASFEYQAASDVRIQAKRTSKNALKAKNKGRNLQKQAERKAALKAQKLRLRDASFQKARSLEQKAERRTLGLRQALKQDRTAREKALQLARAAHLKAEKLGQRLVSQQRSISLAQQHEMALKKNR